MKSKNTYLFSLLVVGSVLFSCKKEVEPPAPEPYVPEPEMFFNMKFDNENLKISDDAIKPVKVGTKVNADIKMGNHYFNVYIRDTLKVGVPYVFEEGGNGKGAIYYRDTSDMTVIFKSQSGSLTVTKWDQTNKLIFGKFEGLLKISPNSTLLNSVTLKEGEFKFRYK